MLLSSWCTRLFAATIVLAVYAIPGYAQRPVQPIAPEGPITQVQSVDLSADLPVAPSPNTPMAPPPPTQPVVTPVSGQQTPGAAVVADAPPTTAPPAAPGGVSNTVTISGLAPAGTSAGVAPTPTQALNSGDLGNLLSKSENAQGLEVQRRNAIVSDPRLRGLRNSQFLSVGDGAPYFPARLDLDTPISKFSPAIIRDVVVTRGPYTTLLGPGFGFLSISTLNAPRSTNGGTEYHTMTSLGYQTNGEQWNGQQMVTAAGESWGFRGNYNILQGNDYRDGAGNLVPGSYLSNNFNAALGFDLLPDDSLTLDFKILRSFQDNLEFPGLFFDIDRSDTEAYSTRLTAKKIGPFDLATADLWYNATTARGSTRGGAKQAFVNRLIKFAFEEPFLTRLPNGQFARDPLTGRLANLQGFEFQDASTTAFAERSIGYRFAGTWGDDVKQPSLTLGTDLNVFGQSLEESIRFRRLDNGPIDFGTRDFQQNQSIPKSNSVDAGLFLEGRLPANEWLTLKSGARLDFVNTSSTTQLITGNVDLFGLPQAVRRLGVNPQNRFSVDPIIYSVDPNQRDRDRNFVLLAGFLSSEYKITENLLFSAAYGYAERAPNLTELYAAGPFLGVLQQGTARLIGDPNLSKERAHQVDLGLRYDNKVITAGVNGFYSYIQDYITYDANRLSDIGLSQVVYTNTDLATLAGAELYLAVKASKWLTPFGSLSYVQGIDHTRFDTRRNSIQPDGSVLDSSRRRDPKLRAFATDTEPLPQIPPMESRLGLRLHSPDTSPRWQVEYTARIVSGQNSIARSLGELPSAGFTTHDIRAYWQVSKTLLVTAGVENLGDLLYREHLDPIAANTLSRVSGQPVPQLFRPGYNIFFTTQFTY